MFRFADAGKVWVPVVLPFGDREGAVTIHVLMRLFTRDELRERERKVMQNASSSLASHPKAITNADEMTALLDEISSIEATDIAELIDRTSDWRDVLDDQPQPEPLPYSAENLAALLNYEWFFRAQRSALFEASRLGVAKNWKPGPGGTPARVQA